MAEDRQKRGGKTRRFISSELRQLTPLIRNNSAGTWRCFAYVSDDEHRPQGFTFDEILSVTDLTTLGMLVFQLKSGLLGREAYGSNAPKIIGSPYAKPEPLISGEQVFRWWPASM
jgi:hypothetical protein